MLSSTQVWKNLRTSASRPVQLPQEVQVLVGFLNDSGDVGVPDDGIGQMHPEVIRGDHFHCCSTVEWKWGSASPAEI